MAMTDRNNPQRAGSSDSQMTILEFMREFPDDATCLEWLWTQRFSADGEHAHCERCDAVTPFKRYATKQRRQAWTCTQCGLHVHPTAGTIFHKSSTSLHLWFYAMYLMTSTRCGISAKQLERELGVTYKTAWRMFHLIRRELMGDDEAELGGDVEMDETYVGGKPRKAEVRAMAKTGLSPMQAGQAAARAKKVTVFGMVERGGKVVARVTANQFQGEAVALMHERVLPASVIYTDEAAAYNSLSAKGYQHKRIHHASKVYVVGDTHTNTIEGFWSLLKNGLRGVYHSVSAKHLQTYLNEYAWRYNHRDDAEPMFRTMLAQAALPRECRSLAG
jgi:transposase-like protein